MDQLLTKHYPENILSRQVRKKHLIPTQVALSLWWQRVKKNEELERCRGTLHGVHFLDINTSLILNYSSGIVWVNSTSSVSCLYFKWEGMTWEISMDEKKVWFHIAVCFKEYTDSPTSQDIGLLVYFRAWNWGTMFTKGSQHYLSNMIYCLFVCMNLKIVKGDWTFIYLLSRPK